MAKHKRVLDVIGVIGELLITAGVLILLYVVWQLGINDPVVSNVQQQQAQQAPISTPVEKQFLDADKNLKQGKVFGRIYIPRFSNDYVRQIGQGTFQKVTLNKIGVGHYVRSQWPGQEGNFAVAAHRTSHGAPFNKIDTLQEGDNVYVETNDGWFTYTYRQTAIVDPTFIEVIDKVPVGMTGARKGGRYMTMTSCHPKWSNKQRIIVWLELTNQNEIMPLELKQVIGR
jgi:sortase A